MLVGHFSVAFIAKRIEPKLSLGTLILASMIPDFLWCIFLIAGIEDVRVKPGITIANGMRAIDVLEAHEIAFSHSLVTDIVWAGIFAGVYSLWRRDGRAAWILFIAVMSHWLLDFASHPPDMPLVPGLHHYFGLGLWNSIPATIVVEGLMWLLALFFYASATRSRKRAGPYVLYGGAAILTLVWLGNIAGPPPSNLSTIGFSSLTFFLLTVGWAYWVNRLRTIGNRQPLYSEFAKS